MKTNEIRKCFFDFFVNQGHRHLPSSSLVPDNDPSLLFTNAGMVQFKDVFLGQIKPPTPSNRAVTSQRCVRAGGKHNDLDNVGFTARHHTFFEMLGNFSFGDYFKTESIEFCWQFITEVLKIPKDKLWVTVYAEDQEAFDIWVKNIGFPPERMSRIGDKDGQAYHSDNFWQMDDTGPCGPCTEIFYDHGESVEGGPPGSPDEDGDRYVEIWNLVFMQYQRKADGQMLPLAKPSVDTGMGLERLAAVLQGVHSNYHIDLFKNLIRSAANILNQKDLELPSLKVIADHIRSIAFLIIDGVLPSNEGRGYVLRRIMRRAILHGNKLGAEGSFLHQLVPTLVHEMGDAYPELNQNQAHIEKIILEEEKRFSVTLNQGLSILGTYLKQVQNQTLDGHLAFKLYDTYGFPYDLTETIAREHGIKVDEEGFESAMEVQRNMARNAGKFAVDYSDDSIETKSEFTGYQTLEQTISIAELFSDDGSVERLTSGQSGRVVLSQTPFYPESGGQVGDCGVIESDDAVFEVSDTQKMGEAIVHYGVVRQGEFTRQKTAIARVDVEKRHAAQLNHSATHLLHRALVLVLGDQVSQKGSLINSERLRFDFSYSKVVTEEELKRVEQMVNEEIWGNTAIIEEHMPIDEAMASGAKALFGEKYAQEVRVLSIGQSKELCGGCHVERTGDIGLFKIISESSVASGIRRIEAVTGQAAFAVLQNAYERLAHLADLYKVPMEEVWSQSQLRQSQQRQLEKELKQLKSELLQQQANDLLAQANEIGNVKVLVGQLTNTDAKALKDQSDQLKHKLGERAVVVLALVQAGRAHVVVSVSKSITEMVNANHLLQFITQIIDGKGGGRPDMAQGGGNDVQALPKALSSVTEWVENAVNEK